MKLREILQPATLIANFKSTDKAGVIGELAAKVAESYPQLDKEHIIAVLLERERLGSTGIGNGVAIPHGKLPGLDTIIAAFGRSLAGVDFESHDKAKTTLFFALLAPEEAVGSHLKALARISRLLKEPKLREQLMQAGNAENIYEMLMKEDEVL